MSFPTFRAAVYTCFTLLLLPQASLAQGAPGHELPPQKVGVISVKKERVPQTFSLPGRAVAFQQVLVRPRVSGVVTDILYQPGKMVKVGDPLFKLDDASYVATVAADNAAFLSAEANLPVKQAAFDRAKALLGQGSTQVQLEAAQSDLATAQATLDSTKAALDYSEKQLAWTTITSPIEGFPEVATVSVGDLVSAAQTNAMTTITRLDPIYVDMLETSARLLQIRNEIDNGTLAPNQSVNAQLELEDGQVYKGQGKLVAPSAIVSSSTGTFSVRFQFDNPKRMILPGMFVQGTADLGTTDAVLVPQRAATRSSAGDLTAFIVKDGKADLVTLSAVSSYNNNWVVTAGLNEGDQLIVDGLKMLSAGQAVAPEPATVDADGLVALTQNANGAAPAPASTPAPAPTSGTAPAAGASSGSSAPAAKPAAAE
ncbi:efflux RND transporter periplasmic adaptor subunit [Paracoccus aminophilus]|uniref:RND family efflux transporter MFP subunit n=1 Tax=Paracoccus aminophilus JCM 7686 TaxID=1367847 RepID=S5YIS2_PARAH|nr:efflux RND transporter periplasmic adaptor subunit [Paracoccus aminophilus]AGT11373.1 RND family efflux transporter MFP subunit [Paracoccus aminophilus JCM 7686]